MRFDQEEVDHRPDRGHSARGCSAAALYPQAAPFIPPVLGGLLVSYLAHRLSNPLPSGIRTFRDLAKAIVTVRSEPQHG